MKSLAASVWKSLISAVLFSCCMTASTIQADSLERVEYRLTEWKTLHFDEATQAKEYFDTFKSIGCEAKQDSHGNHTDVLFRCPKWRSLSLKSHQEAHKWEAFLKKAGFETAHKH